MQLHYTNVYAFLKHLTKGLDAFLKAIVQQYVKSHIIDTFLIQWCIENITDEYF